MKLRGFNLPIEHISATSLAKAIQCPEQWRRRYLLHEKDKMFPGRFLGIIDHETHEENFSQKIESGQDLELDWMIGRYAANWDTTVEKIGEPEWVDDDPLEMFNRGKRMLAAYHTYCSPKVQPVKVEERFMERIEGVPVPVLGYMDIQTVDRIVERKTANKKISKPKPEWRFQARVYQLIADMPTEWHVVTSQVEPKIYLPESEPALFLEKGDPDAIVKVIQQTVIRLSELYDRYGADSSWPTEGLFHPFLCDYCQFKEWGCPAWLVGSPSQTRRKDGFDVSGAS